MRVVVLLLCGSLLLGCSSTSDDYVQDMAAQCGRGDRMSCEALSTMHPQALLDAEAIMLGMQQARLRRELFRRAMP